VVRQCRPLLGLVRLTTPTPPDSIHPPPRQFNSSLFSVSCKYLHKRLDLGFPLLSQIRFSGIKSSTAVTAAAGNELHLALSAFNFVFSFFCKKTVNVYSPTLPNLHGGNRKLKDMNMYFATYIA